ncbi:MAG: glycosyltransferase family 1 protein, partial [Actinomycetia bacterium]|nr:glycosyltransferase family 1 protein [Actinomycetes bacterium]
MTDLSTHTDPALQLAQMRRVAANLWWSWHHPATELVASLPGASECHPVMTVDHLHSQAPETAAWLAANGQALAGQFKAVEQLEQRVNNPQVAYFCPEFGVVAQVPQYSGGLGILAGDHLKASSDLDLPLVGVGLFYRRGFFRQEIVDGTQIEHYEDVDPIAIGAIDTGVLVEVSVNGEPVHLGVWEMWVGATRMLLLDSDIEENSPDARRITDRLYAGDRRHRLSQELVLGVGGVRALRALNCRPDVYHLNEGHACFLLLELLAELVDADIPLAEARTRVRSSTLFTTHTPVPAGIDRFDRELVEPELQGWAERLGVPTADILDWATLPSDGVDKPFNTAALAFAFCGRVNGVSQLHATVSQRLFGSLPQAAGIEGITNGVHARTWVAPGLQDLYDEVLGSGWENGDEDAWAGIEQLDGERFAKIKADYRVALIDLIYGITGTQFDPDGCILGFARRFATYKRANLLLLDTKGLQDSIDAGAQFVFAGKAHPADTEGKALLAEIGKYAQTT